MILSNYIEFISQKDLLYLQKFYKLIINVKK